MDLSIVVPCYNEEGSLPLLFSAVDDAFATSGVSYELVLVNDGSSDDTSRLLHELPTPASAERTVVVDFSRNFGKESALLAGLQINVPLGHHRKHRIINSQAVAAKERTSMQLTQR